jgi:tRNA threonylcarbamoyladenosine biosynthesis protein TsaE
LSVRHRAEGAAATRALGANIARAILASEPARATSLLVTLSGDLGAGKTTLVGGLLEALGHVGPTRSPTYTLVEPYRFGDRDVCHCDLYRLRDPEELEDLGLRDTRGPGSVLLVEWPEKAAGRLGPADLAIDLRYVGEHVREARLEAPTPAGQDVLTRL